MPQPFHKYSYSGLTVPIHSPFCPILQDNEDNGKYKLTEGFVFDYKRFEGGEFERLEILGINDSWGDINEDNEIVAPILVFLTIETYGEGDQKGEIIEVNLNSRGAADPAPVEDNKYTIDVCKISADGVERYLYENIHWQQELPTGILDGQLLYWHEDDQEWKISLEPSESAIPYWDYAEKNYKWILAGSADQFLQTDGADHAWVDVAELPTGARGDMLMHDGVGWVRLLSPPDASPEDPLCLKHDGDLPFWDYCESYF